MSPRCGMHRSLALVSLLVFACNTRDAKPGEGSTLPSQHEAPTLLHAASEADAASVTLARDAGSDTPPRAALVRPAARMKVSALRGNVQSAGVALNVGVELTRAALLELGRGDTITLSLGDHARVHVVGPALVQLLPDGEPAVLLREGLVTLDVSPRGIRALESAFWLATPSLRFDVPDSVRVAVRAFPNAATELAVVSGYLTVAQPQRPLAVPGGSSVCVTLVEAKLVPLKLATLELAETKLGSAKSCAPRARDDGEALERARKSAVAALESAATFEQDQLAEHSRQVETDAGRAIQLREELSHLGVELSHLGDTSRALQAQHRARALGQKELKLSWPGDKKP